MASSSIEPYVDELSLVTASEWLLRVSSSAWMTSTKSSVPREPIVVELVLVIFWDSEWNSPMSELKEVTAVSGCGFVSCDDHWAVLLKEVLKDV